ncbi:MAG: hypothetical protein ACRDGA_03010, partial [Bacteroidota bacterium]
DAGLLAALGVGESGSLPQASEASAAAEELSLSSYPNPFNPSTQFKYQISAQGFVSFKIYDLLGREVTVLVNEE